METFQKFMSFLLGMLIVIGAALHQCPRVAAIAVGLLLMGVFTVPEVLGFIKGKIETKEEEE